MDCLRAFTVARLPEIHFGDGVTAQAAQIIARFGQRVLIVTGRRSFLDTPQWAQLRHDLTTRHMSWELLKIEDEPSPEVVDGAVRRFRETGIQVVAGIGGGSALDAAKAIAGLLVPGNSVMDHLEGVGNGAPYHGPALPFVALPTTAGTGSEATKNAVLSLRGEGGFKKSFRHESLVAQVAIIDPQLLRTCPKRLIAANGMDAFTQLLESYVSANASPFTDALAWSGLEAFRDGFWPSWETEHPDADAGYGRIAYASLLSGITLAQAGLGSVHGLASPLGAYFPIPHGEVCGTLVAEATAMNIRALQQRQPDAEALKKYARVSRLLNRRSLPEQTEALNALTERLREWTERLQLPRLGSYGLGPRHIDTVVANCRGGSMRTNPLVLTDHEVAEVLRARL